jgi:hypothetical protein
MPALRGFFRILNRFFMVPVFRLGLGSLLVNPLTGYIMVLRTIGHRTGKIRYVPVNYALEGGCIYCFVGIGNASHWYRNLRKNPGVDAMLPGGAVFGRAETVSDAADNLRLVRAIFRNAGFAGFFEGVNPHTCSDERLAEAIKDGILVRIRPEGPGAGAADPGGWAWMTGWMVWIACILAAVILLR